jgi:hypothetical protein
MSAGDHPTHGGRPPERCGHVGWERAATSAERWIIRRESSGNPHARVDVSTSTGYAFGLGQVTTSNRERLSLRLHVNPDSVDPCVQLRIMRAYVQERYGSTAHAVAWWRSNGWY